MWTYFTGNKFFIFDDKKKKVKGSCRLFSTVGSVNSMIHCRSRLLILIFRKIQDTHRFFSSSLTKDHRLAETISYDRSRSRKNEYLISFSSQLNGNKNKTKCCFESLTKTKALSVFFFNRTSYNKQNMKNYWIVVCFCWSFSIVVDFLQGEHVIVQLIDHAGHRTKSQK